MLNLIAIILLLFTTINAPAWAGPATSGTRSDLHKVVFWADGSTCAACLRKLERTLRKTKGILQVVVSLSPKGKTTIIYDAKKTSMPEISKKLATQNYKPSDIKDKKIDKLPDVPIYARRSRLQSGNPEGPVTPSLNQLK